MLHNSRKRIKTLKDTLAQISQEQQNIKLTREDIEEGTEKFINYTNLSAKSEKIKEELADAIIIQHDDIVLEPASPY